MPIAVQFVNLTLFAKTLTANYGSIDICQSTSTKANPMNSNRIAGFLDQQTRRLRKSFCQESVRSTTRAVGVTFLQWHFFNLQPSGFHIHLVMVDVAGLADFIEIIPFVGTQMTDPIPAFGARHTLALNRLPGP